jgi:hypothetical protein
MFMEKVKLDSSQGLLASVLLAAGLIFLAETLAPQASPLISGLRLLAGLYLFFYPVGALALKALKLESEDGLEGLMLALTASLSLIVVAHLLLYLALGLAFNLTNSLGIITGLGIALFLAGKVGKNG